MYFPCGLNNFKNKIENIEAQIDEFLRTPSLGQNLLVLIKIVMSTLYFIREKEVTLAQRLKVPEIQAILYT